MTVVELVRHASAGKRGRWPGGPDEHRPLDGRGADQASALVDVLTDGDLPPVVEVRTSPAARCRQTVAPLAERLGLEVVDEPLLQEANHVPLTDAGSPWVAAAWLGARVLGLLDDLVARQPGRVVLCSHGDVIPATMAALAGRDRLDLLDVACRKAGRWRVVFEGGHAVSAVLLDPPDRPWSHS